jgi:hypothetical protein
MGPHSIFIAAEDVAALQGMADAGSPQAPMEAMDMGPPASRDASEMTSGHAHAMALTATSKASHPTPNPAGMAMDAMVAISIPDHRPDLVVTGALAAIWGDLLLPPGRLLPAPEPPPP